MALKFGCIICIALLCLLARSNPIEKRQRTGGDLNTYITSVRTALYVLDNIGTASDACLDSGLVARLDGGGYDGDYARQLLYVPHVLSLGGLY